MGIRCGWDPGGATIQHRRETESWLPGFNVRTRPGFTLLPEVSPQIIISFMDLKLEKKEIVKILEEIGTLLELSGENPFKTRAYSAGARALEARTESLAELIESGELGKIKGIGKALKEKIETLAEAGELEYYSDLKAKFPDSLMAGSQNPQSWAEEGQGSV